MPALCLLRLSERTVRHYAPLLARNELAAVLQWTATLAVAFLDETFEPGCPIGDDLLKLRRGKPLRPIVAAKKEQVIGFLCWCAYSGFLVAGLDQE